jgi:hypothetical protein
MPLIVTPTYGIRLCRALKEVMPRVYTQSPKGTEEEVYGRPVRAIMYNDSDLLKK